MSRCTKLEREELKAKSLGEKLADAMLSRHAKSAAWLSMDERERANFESIGVAFAASLTHDETASAVIASLTARAEKAERQRDRLLDVLARVRVMFRLDLRNMITFGKNYNQAVKDVHDAVIAALSPDSQEGTHV